MFAILTATLLAGTAFAATVADLDALLPAIANIDGDLKLEGDSASFRKSCGSIGLATSISGVTLNANCPDTSGAFNASSIPIDGIENNNGTA